MIKIRPSWDTTWLHIAILMARRSKCVRDQVGAVIVDASNRIVATGYNGPPAGFDPIGVDGESIGDLDCSHWCTRAKHPKHVGWIFPDNSTTDAGPFNIEKRSNDKTYIVWKSYEVELTIESAKRYNIKPKWADRSSDYSDCPSLHAEANALSVCDRSSREGGTIYVTSAICFGCAKLIANSGLAQVIVRNFDANGEAIQHRNWKKSREFLESCGIDVATVNAYLED